MLGFGCVCVFRVVRRRRRKKGMRGKIINVSDSRKRGSVEVMVVVEEETRKPGRERGVR